MALYKELDYDQVRNIINPPRPTTPIQNDTYNTIGQKSGVQASQQSTGGLEGFLGGLGNTIGNVGRSLLGLFGSGAAAVRDLAGGSTSKTFSLKEMQDTIDANRNLEGADQRVVDSYQKALDTAKANGLNEITGYWDDNGLFKLGGEGKNQSEFKKWLYGENEKTGTANYAKAAGEALDAASTLSNFIPGANGLVGNTLQGAASGFGQAYADTGGNLEAALKSAAAGGAAGLATGGLNKGLNNAIAKGGKLANLATSKPLASTIARGALSGAVGGAVGGGTAAGLNNGDILAGAAQGAGSGLGGGLIAAPVMYGTNKLISKTPLGGIQSALNEMEQDYQTAKQKIGPKSQLGSSLVEESQQPVEKSILPQEDENVNPNLRYGESELAGRTATQNRGNMLQRLGEVMEGGQSNTTRVQNRKLGVKSAGNAIDKVYKKTGISDLDAQTELAKELTGGPRSYLDEIQRTALSATEDGSTRTVDTSDIVRKVEPLIDAKISETNLSGKKRQQFITSLRRDIQKGDTITAANNLKEQAQVLLDKKENMTPLDKQQAKVYRELANELDDLSYNAVPKDNVDAMFETAISESRGRSEQAKRAGNQQIATAYEKIANDLEKLPRTIQAFRSFKKDFVDVAKMGELSALGEQAVLAQNGANITGNLKRFVNKALQKPTNQALAWAGSKISDAGEKMASSTPTVPNVSTQAPETLPGTVLPVDRLGNAIGRAEGARAAGNSLEAQLANMNTNEALQPTQNGLNGDYYTGADVYGNTAMPTTYNAGYNTQANAGTDMLNRLQRAMELAIEAGDGTAVSQLMGMYTDLAKIYQTEEPKQTKLTATQQRANAAASSLQRLANMTPDTGYTVSGIPGIGDLLNMRGNSYLSEAQSLAQQIGYMVSGANIKKEEAENIGKAYVPQPFDSEQIRNEKLQRAAEIIAMYQNGYAEE